jgi:hypothetical protein
MSLKRLIAIVSLAVLLAFGPAREAATQPVQVAQSGGPVLVPARPARPRIEINPRPLLHRRCASWYVVQDRPSGRVLFPEKHCWWERG